MKSNNKIDKYAFLVLKPDAIRQFLDINIVQELLKEDLEIIKRKMIKMNERQVAVIYAEKLRENYYPLLEKFMTENPSTCLILKSEQNAIEKSQQFKDGIREKFKICKFRISDKDLRLLRAGKHPQQEKITHEVALENLIHAANDFGEVCKNIDSLFAKSELLEIKELEPELYQLFLEYHREKEAKGEIMLKIK